MNPTNNSSILNNNIMYNNYINGNLIPEQIRSSQQQINNNLVTENNINNIGITVDDISSSNNNTAYNEFKQQVKERIDYTNALGSSREFIDSNLRKDYLNRSDNVIKSNQLNYNNIYNNINSKSVETLTNDAATALRNSNLGNQTVSNVLITNDFKTAKSRAIIINVPSIPNITLGYNNISQNTNNIVNQPTVNNNLTNNCKNEINSIQKKPLWPRNNLQCLQFTNYSNKEINERYKAEVLKKKKLTRNKENTKKFKWSKASHHRLHKYSDISRQVIDNNNSITIKKNNLVKKYSTSQSDVPGNTFLSFNKQVPYINKNVINGVNMLPFNYNNYTNFLK